MIGGHLPAVLRMSAISASTAATEARAACTSACNHSGRHTVSADQQVGHPVLLDCDNQTMRCEAYGVRYDRLGRGRWECHVVQRVGLPSAYIDPTRCTFVTLSSQELKWAPDHWIMPDLGSCLMDLT